MFKFLRKYNKWILAVGGTLLMIVFLIPQALQGLSQQAGQSGATQATVGEGDDSVTAEELRQVSLELQAMDRLGLGVPGLGRITDSWHWYLLTREAEQAGLVGAGLSSLLPAEQARLFSQQSGLPVSVLDSVSAKINGVARMLSLYQRSAPFSDRRLRQAADRLFYTVQVQPVVIEASAGAVDYIPTEDEILAQMLAHADKTVGEDDAVFGYKLPNRVRLEWLSVPVESVREMIEASGAVNQVALYKHWSANSGTGDIPVKPDPVPAEIPDEVRDDLLDTLTTGKMLEIARSADNLLQSRIRGLAQSEGYYVLPDDWAANRLGFQELARTLAERFEIALPVYRSEAEWLDDQAVRELEGIGSASTDKFPPGRKRLADLVVVAKEFGGSPTVPCQAGVAGPVLTDDDGSLYVFRMIDVDASRAPTSVDEVREQVVADLKRMKHFESLRAQVPELERKAEQDGLMTLAVANDTIVHRQQPVVRYDRFAMTRQQAFGQPLEPEPSSLPGIGPSKDTVDAIIEYARALPEGPIDELDEAQRIIAIPVEGKLAVVVARILHLAPVTQEVYAQYAESDQLQRILLSEELGGNEWVEEAFGRDALASRHNFKLPEPDVDVDPAAQPADATSVATAE